MPPADSISPVSFVDELNQSYLDYAMSVIVGRALPDVRDGLKPVHRRVLFAMNELRNFHNRPYVKSARVVGEVIGKYHPHGDTAAYDTIVRMAQDFSMRLTLVDGQGNFGSVDGDAPAAQRYTEVRMTRFASTLLEDLDKDAVEFTPNYDDTLQIPKVLPARAPNLLINGSAGIAVGMATNIPPHNPSEVIAACLVLLDNPKAQVNELMEHIQGPDFPTGAIINGRAGILQAYSTGRGSIRIRSKADIETDDSGRETIVVSEIPYQVNKAAMIGKIAGLVKEKKITGIAEIRDESNKDGLRVVIEIKRNESAEIVLNNLYTQTQLEKSYGINMVALVEDRPRQLNLKAMLECFLSHRKRVVIRRTQYLLASAKARGHLLEGQLVALSNIDRVVELIKQSQDTAIARAALMEVGWQSDGIEQLLERIGQNLCRPDDLPAQYGYREGLYYLSERQAQSILELRLQRLTGLEQDKVMAEYDEVTEAIATYQAILSDAKKMTQVIREELSAVAESYASPRLTSIIESQRDITHEDLIDPEDRLVTVSRKGYAKAMPIDDYDAIGRGGRGRSVAVIQDDDFIVQMLVANTHDTTLWFSNIGKVHWLKVYRIPVQSRQARGRPLVNFLQLEEGEEITTFLPMADEPEEDRFIFMATASGRVKKTSLAKFARQRGSGLIALRLEEGNTLIDVAITDGTRDILLISSAGKAVRFHESEVREMGRTAAGVRGMRLGEGERVVGMIVVNPEQQILLASENGYGKRLSPDSLGVKHRNGKGMIVMRTNERNGAVVAAVQLEESDQMVLVSDRGQMLRTSVAEVSLQGRRTQGVKLMNLLEGESLVTLQPLIDQEKAVEELDAGNGKSDSPIV